MFFFLGLIFGSFISSLSYRIPRGVSIVKGRSFCPRCRSKISWYDNIPLLAFLLLRGRCRKCHKKISFRYPLIELVCGLGFWFIGYNPILLFIFCLSLLILVIDWERKIIPDDLVFLGLAVLLLFLLAVDEPLIFAKVLAGLSAASLLLILNLVTLGRGMGLGDVKLAILLGVFVGLPRLPLAFFLAFLTGAAVGVILMLLGKTGWKRRIAFGPFMVVGFWASILLI